MSNALSVCFRGRVPYELGYAEQVMLREKVKSRAKNPFQLYICEHEHVISKGRNFTAESLLYPEQYYKENGVSLVNTDRGGDITYHGLGQITAYFIFDLNYLKKDIHWFIHQLEEIVISVLNEYGVSGLRNKINSGVWVGNNKICAIGVGFKHWISYHGIGFNINSDLKYFDMIVPCGLKNAGVTSLKKVLQKNDEIQMNDVSEKLVQKTIEVFNFEKDYQLEDMK